MALFLGGTQVEVFSAADAPVVVDAVWGKIVGDIGRQSDLSGILAGKADAASIPTTTSQLQNDSGFLTAHQPV